MFEDNSGNLELARTQKLRPCNKHTNVVYNHFQETLDIKQFQSYQSINPIKLHTYS